MRNLVHSNHWFPINDVSSSSDFPGYFLWVSWFLVGGFKWLMNVSGQGSLAAYLEWVQALLKSLFMSQQICEVFSHYFFKHFSSEPQFLPSFQTPCDTSVKHFSTILEVPEVQFVQTRLFRFSDTQTKYFLLSHLQVHALFLLSSLPCIQSIQGASYFG